MKAIAAKVGRWIMASLALAICAVGASPAAAQMPARFYWKSLSGGNAVPLLIESMSGNANPFDKASLVTPDGAFDGTLALTGYARTFTLFDRSAMGAIILPMGRVAGEVTVNGKTFRQTASGFGDPMFEFNLNLIGPKAQKTIPDALRYEPGFSVDLLADIAIPIGEYNAEQPLNLGLNRWYGRVGAPILWQLGAWVPGRRTTIEVLPSIWLFGRNTDYLGTTLETDPLFQVDGHLTRDFTDKLWASFDTTYVGGAKSTIDGKTGDELGALGVGLTLGYQITDNIGATVGYKATINDKAPTDLRFDRFMFTLVFGWHPIIEGARRLQHGE
ncbi:transporter [Thermaurantiacus sp.]